MAVSIEIRTTCPKCGNPVPVNALVSEVQCPSCQQRVSLDARFWQGVNLKIGARALIAETETGPEVLENGTSVTTNLADPSCAACGGELSITDNMLQSGPTSIACACGASTPIRPVPRALIPNLRMFCTHVIGEAPEQQPPLGQRAVLVASEPVMFPCPNCGGALPVDGSERTAKCAYCRTNAYLPDDLWRRLHPVKSISRWYVWIDAALYARYQADMRAGRHGCALAAISMVTLMCGVPLLLAAIADNNTGLRTLAMVLVAVGALSFAPSAVLFRRWDCAR
jgi:hypothetical protein